jgi:tRNA(Ile)-lysidine synthase
VTATEDVTAYAEDQALSVEMAARSLRYRFLFGVAKSWKAQAVAVGHTLDDQAETLLMHWLSGTGLEGLKGMEVYHLPNAWSQKIPLVRPLLGVRREETVAYCQERGLQPVIDRTNLEGVYLRSRLRRELIPILETYNPRLKENLLRTAQVVRGDLEILENHLSVAWKACVQLEGRGFVCVKRIVFLTQPLGIQRRMMRKAILLLRPGLREAGFEAVERTVQFMSRPPMTGQVDLLAGLRLFSEGDLAWLATWEADIPLMDWPQLQKGCCICLEKLPAAVELPGGWRLCLEEIVDLEAARQSAYTNGDPYQAWIDADRLPEELEVRRRQPGDCFHPLGMGGHTVNLSDFMINVKMPRRARAGWPLLCAGEDLLWVPGYALDHRSRITPVTQRIMRCQLIAPASSTIPATGS